MFVPLDLCKLSNKQNVFQLAEAIHFAFRIFVHSLSFQICLSCLVETSFYDRLWMLCSSQTKDQKQLNAGTKTAKGGIPLANGDAQLQRPPPWAYPLQPDVQQPNTQQLLRSASKAIDRAMAHLWESKLKVVDVSFSIELRKPQSAARQMETLKFEQRIEDSRSLDTDQDCQHSGPSFTSCNCSRMEGEPGECRCPSACTLGGSGLLKDLVSGELRGTDELMNTRFQEKSKAKNPWGRKKQKDNSEDEEWVSVVLSVVPGLNMEDIEEEQPARKKDHRRIPSTIAMAEVKVSDRL
jgi:hypothetical protein